MGNVCCPPEKEQPEEKKEQPSSSQEKKEPLPPSEEKKEPILPSEEKKEQPPSSEEKKKQMMEEKKQPPSSQERKEQPRPSEEKKEQPRPSEEVPYTVDDCIKHLKAFNGAQDVDEAIIKINIILNSIEHKSTQRSTGSETASPTQKVSLWNSFVKGGAVFLDFCSKHAQKSMDKGDLSSQLDDAKKVATQVLQTVGQMHWIVGGLCMVACVLDQIDQVRENKSECVELLRQMVQLAEHIKQLQYEMPQYRKKFEDAISLIVEGSFMCASQLNSKSFFRYLTASVESQHLNSLRLKISHLYSDMTLTTVKEIKIQLPTVARPPEPEPPKDAVGIQQQQEKLMKLLDLTAENGSSLAVIIYGFGGIGKTTLAKAVVYQAQSDLKRYNYAYSQVEINEDASNHDMKILQQHILSDIDGKELSIRDCTTGRHYLRKAFESCAGRPLFIYIDNALRTDNLKEIFPEDLQCLPQNSRILVTTRDLGVTDVLKDRGLQRREYRVQTLPSDDAKKILFKDLGSSGRLQNVEEERILKICNGIPLVLKIVGAHLKKQGYRTDNCTQILEALQKGIEVKEENLSDRLVDFVYKKFELSTQEAFLDICSFFNRWEDSHVKSIVGTEQATSLEEAALVVLSVENKLNVHDVIAAKGRTISQSNRITDLQSLSDAAEHQKLKEIKGICFIEDETTYVLEETQLNSMAASLRVLALGNRMNVSGQSQKSFKELRFLRLGGDVPFLPVNLQKLERLAVYHGPIFKKDFSLYQLPKTVRVVKAMEQSDCEESSHMGQASTRNSSLKELDLTQLRNLQKLPQGIDQFAGLETLILDEWDKVEELPEEICHLSKLSKLSICGGNSLRHLPQSFDQLSSLKELNLNNCWNLEDLPPSFGKLNSLKKLILQSHHLKELPSSFGGLHGLTELTCNCLELTELPSSFGQLHSLKKLDLTFCFKLQRLPSGFGHLRSLEDLNLSSCYKLEELPSNFELKSLKMLDLRNCDCLKKIPPGLKQKGKNITLFLPDGLSKQFSS